MNLEQIMQMANMLGAMLKPPENEKKEEIKNYPLPFDEGIQTQDMKMIKSIIPYMNISQQKIIGVVIKLMEIKNIIEKDDETIVTVQSHNDDERHKDILLAVKPYCPEDKQNMLNMMLRMFELKKILVQLETLREVL